MHQAEPQEDPAGKNWSEDPENTFMVAGRAPCGVTLLGTTDSVPAPALKVKFF